MDVIGTKFSVTDGVSSDDSELQIESAELTSCAYVALRVAVQTLQAAPLAKITGQKQVSSAQVEAATLIDRQPDAAQPTAPVAAAGVWRGRRNALAIWRDDKSVRRTHVMRSRR